MKFLTLLLSLIVLTLTIVPCCALEKDADQLSLKALQQHTQKDEDCCKDCSPFYVCGTCVGFTINNFLSPTFTIYLRPVKHDSAYLTVELPQIPVVIWQPPQLS
ncbi:DUF6660 family protein [Pedobacter cryoconitis]|uniref:DUF6660 family protein n=1 Tax=Pedobacter cryoconitis TaxID=188932 RepID=UPI00161FE0B4|nr:DUF6660 family protein [Pedobacter cryoconitis]MBB5647082.1 hypothetical protein [Pedobacter cryoconitis]